MNRTIAIVLAALVGCAPTVYQRPNTGSLEVDRDLARCEYEAASSTAGYGSGQNTARTNGGATAQGFAAGIGQAMESNNLIALCMRAKGYARGQPVAVASDPREERARQMYPTLAK